VFTAPTRPLSATPAAISTAESAPRIIIHNGQAIDLAQFTSLGVDPARTSELWKHS